MIGPELEKSLQRAQDLARALSHEYLTIEHIFCALLEDDAVREIIQRCGGQVHILQDEIREFLENKIPKVADQEFDPIQTMAVQRVLQRAALHVQTCGKELMDGGNVLVSIFRERECFSAFLLEKQGVTRFDVINYISHGIAKDNPKIPTEHQVEGDEPSDPLSDFCTDLIAKAKAGKIDPLIGRQREIERTIQVLCRRKKNNPVYVGDPGVGKTAIAEGLALQIAEEAVPEVLRDAQIFSLDLGALLANTKYRGEFEARLKAVMKSLQNLPKAILFIDEIHTIVGAGATSGGTMDASNILKPALASGELRCIGSTTYEDYKTAFERDHALARRFQKIDVNEPSVEETYQILIGLKRHYEDHHGVHYARTALRAAAELAAKHINHRHLPDKAIDVLDEVGAAQRMLPAEKRKKTVGVREVEAVVASMARIPTRNVSSDDRDRLQQLEADLKLAVFDQDEALKALADAILLSRSGLRHPQKPVGSFLFTGPTGVGKTEAAQQLARTLGVQFIRFDMSEYMEKHSVSRLIGAPPGYVGFDQGGLLTDSVNKTPYAVLLLDEIEKAHPDIFNILLQVMDHASLTDHNGKKADFRNVVLIMTSNAGAQEMARGTIGFGKESQTQSAGKQALEKLFSPEFRNRLDAIIHFKALTQSTMIKIVHKFIDELDNQLIEKKVSLHCSDRAAQWLAEHGFSPAYGARPLARLIEKEVKQKLAHEILFGQLAKGGTVDVDYEEPQGIVLRVQGQQEKTKIKSET